MAAQAYTWISARLYGSIGNCDSVLGAGCTKKPSFDVYTQKEHCLVLPLEDAVVARCYLPSIICRHERVINLYKLNSHKTIRNKTILEMICGKVPKNGNRFPN
jgi:hypothetical protein